MECVKPHERILIDRDYLIAVSMIKTASFVLHNAGTAASEPAEENLTICFGPGRSIISLPSKGAEGLSRFAALVPDRDVDLYFIVFFVAGCSGLMLGLFPTVRQEVSMKEEKTTPPRQRMIEDMDIRR